MSEPESYWDICVLKAGASKESVFTYHSLNQLSTGQLVQLSFKRVVSLGVVISRSTKPRFTTKEVIKSLDIFVPAYLIQLASWMATHYATPLSRVYATLLPSNLEVVPRKDFTNRQNQPAKTAPSLQKQQKAAIAKILNGKSANYLLHGVTGSGKTLVYIELAKANFAKGKSTIILVPEISLTPQLASNFQDYFGNDVIITHSGMTPSERRFWWHDTYRSKSPKIIIGPRSALFTPLPKLGLIVIDEAHETTYKQDQSPRYNAINVAAKISSILGAKLVLGSATPTASDTYLASKNKLNLVEMPRPVYKNVTQPTKLVNLSDKSLYQRSRFLSEPLLTEIEATLQRGKQSILFMNRRGSARVALCANCDWVGECPNCNIPLTFHADQGIMLCHWCNFQQKPPAVCPSCNQAEIHFLGGGTKRIEDELTRLLPKARLARLDRDSFDAKTMPLLYKKLLNGQIDILIGTQMITKGLDLPGVETIGVVLADTMLYMPDFTAAERTFQLLYQVRGRAGRREGTPSQTIIQTYSPKHPAIQAVVDGNYDDFIANQLKERRELHYPPFVYLLKLDVTRKSRKSAIGAAQTLAGRLNNKTGIEVIGPAPAWRETLGGNFTWQVIVKSPNRQNLVTIASETPPNWSFDLDPINLL